MIVTLPSWFNVFLFHCFVPVLFCCARDVMAFRWATAAVQLAYLRFSVFQIFSTLVLISQTRTKLYHKGAHDDKSLNNYGDSSKSLKCSSVWHETLSIAGREFPEVALNNYNAKGPSKVSLVKCLLSSEKTELLISRFQVLKPSFKILTKSTKNCQTITAFKASFDYSS